MSNQATDFTHPHPIAFPPPLPPCSVYQAKRNEATLKTTRKQVVIFLFFCFCKNYIHTVVHTCIHSIYYAHTHTHTRASVSFARLRVKYQEQCHPLLGWQKKHEQEEQQQAACATATVWQRYMAASGCCCMISELALWVVVVVASQKV